MMEDIVKIEASVIWAIIKSPDGYQTVSETIDIDDFTHEVHKIIFLAAKDMDLNGQHIDIFTLGDRVGYLDYMSELVASGSGISTGVAAKLLEKHSFKRKAVDLLDSARVEIIDSNDMDEQLSIINSMNDKLEKKDSDIPEFKSLAKDCLVRLDQRMNGLVAQGLKTGFEQVDERISGFMPGNLVIVAGRPAMGKTTYAMNIAENVCLNGGNVLVFSMEMSKEEILDRMLSSLSGIEAQKIKSGKFGSEDDIAKLGAGTQKLTRIAPIIIDRPSMHINHVTNLARKINRKNSLDLIVIDYLQLMRTDSKNRFDEISEVSRGLKALAKLTETPVIALSQLSRGVDSRVNNRPVNSDLRESGQIEQDADIIQFLYRDEIYNADSTNKGVCEVITTKFRSGEVGTDYLASELHKNRFANLSYRPEQQEPKETYKYGK